MTSGTDTLKRAAAARALESVRDGMVLGLGTGSTIRFFLDLLAERVRAGRPERRRGGADLPAHGGDRAGAGDPGLAPAARNPAWI